MSEKNQKRKYYQYIQITSVLIIVSILAGYYLYSFIINANLKEVVPGKVYRSAQPSEALLVKWSKKYGIKTIINLRAENPKDTGREKIVAQDLGIKLITLNLSGNRLITSSELVNLINVLQTAQTPLLLHCKSGVDRSGFASMLAAMVIGHTNFDEARNQAYVPPGPWKRRDFSKRRADYVYSYAHISDTFRLYENYCEKNNLDKNYCSQFELWAKGLPPMEKMDINYNIEYSYFPFLKDKGKHFFPIYKLLKGAYVQFSIEILIIVLLIYHTRFCLKLAWSK